jgi:uncharacterized Ntn-hydrolase superfamily protein
MRNNGAFGGVSGSNPTRPVHTYSIVAYDPQARQWGVAVQSHYFCVGRIVGWAEAGVGAVATQSLAEASYGPLGLDMMRAGKSAQQALSGLVESDLNSAVRQVAMVDAQGNVAAHTGGRCIPEAGHRVGKYYSVQANLMLKNTVWDAMAEAFEGARGDLAERMMVALEAAEVEGGDIRGKQSAALLVAQGEMTGRPWDGRPFDLRVDDHAEPLPELRRLLGVARAYHYADEAERIMDDASLGEKRLGMAAETFGRALEFGWAMPGNMELVFWGAIGLASVGMWDDALPLLRQVFAADPAWRDLVPRLVKVGRLADAAGLVERIVSA